MGNYRQHIGFASSLGVAYAGLAYFYAGIHWAYGSVAALLATISGLLPDLDSDTGVEMRGFTGLLGVLVALAVWQHLGHVQPEPAFEYHLIAVVLAYVGVRHFLRRIMSRLSVHRGMSHSLPTGLAWGALAYLHYPSTDHNLRLMMSIAVMVGFGSHLALDEMFSVDLRGARVNRAFGTAIKLWAPSAWSTLSVYLLLSLLSWQVIKVWPEGRLHFTPPSPPATPTGIVREVEEFIKADHSDATGKAATRLRELIVGAPQPVGIPMMPPVVPETLAPGRPPDPGTRPEVRPGGQDARVERTRLLRPRR